MGDIAATHKDLIFCRLEQAGNLAGFGVHIHAAIRRIRRGTGHHGNGAGHRAQELRSAVLQDVADGKTPAAFTGGMVTTAQIMDCRYAAGDVWISDMRYAARNRRSEAINAYLNGEITAEALGEQLNTIYSE